MAITLKSVFQTAANNIVSSSSRSKGSLGTVKREYNDIVKFLDLQKNQIESIKLPDKKKIAQLSNINIASTFGTPGNLLGSLLGGGLDLAGFIGNMFPSKEKAGKSPPVKVNGGKMRFGGIKALGVLNSVFAGLDFYQGVQQGEGVGKAAAGAGASLAGSIVGGALGSFLGPLGTFAGASIGGMAGGWLGDRAYEGVTGTGSKDGVKQKLEEKIKAQEAAQKASVQGGNFEDIITRFSSAVSKFEKGVASGLFGTLGQQSMETEENPTGYDEELSPEDSPTPPEGELGTISYGSGNAEFGETGNVSNSAGWVHGHFQGTSPSSVTTDTTNVVKALLEQGSPVYLNPGVDLIPSKKYSDQELRQYVEGARRAHTHSGSGNSIDVFVKKGTKVPVALLNVGPTGSGFGGYGRGGNAGYIQGTSTWIGHLTPNSKSGVSAPKNKPKGSEDPKIGMEISQKKPEEFFKGTPQEKIFKDIKLKEEFSGKATTPEVKEAQNKYNEYVNQIKQQRTQQVSAQPTQMVAPAAPTQAPQIAQYPSYSQNQFYIIDRPSVIAMGGGGGSSQPVYIPVGGGDGGGTSLPSGPSEGQVVNSLMKTLLLTNLSAS